MKGIYRSLYTCTLSVEAHIGILNEQFFLTSRQDSTINIAYIQVLKIKI